MTERDSTPEPEEAKPSPPPTEPERTEENAVERRAVGDTVGTGTSIALGCVAATLVLIVIGLIFLAVVAILG